MDYKFSDRVKDLSGNAIREIFKLLSRPDIISFAGGLPASDCLPSEQIKQIAAECLSQNPVGILQYGATEGYMPLRQAYIPYVKRCGIENIGVDNVLIVSGGQQAIDLFMKCFLNKGDRLLVQTPTYLAALHIAKTYEAVAVGVNSDSEGLCLRDLERKIKSESPKALYLVPNFSNPTGKTLSLEKRKKILSICQKYGVMILEDDPYRELRYSGSAIPSIKSLDKTGTVVYVSSMSKTVSPALRVGAAIADERVIRKLTIGKQATDVHTATLSQTIIEKFITRGLIDEQLVKAIPIYREKRDAMLTALKNYLPSNVKFTKPDGGLFIWGEFTDGVSARDKFKEAVEKNVAYVSGNDFFANGSGDNCIRLNFSNATAEQIEIGVKRLAAVFKG